MEGGGSSWREEGGGYWKGMVAERRWELIGEVLVVGVCLNLGDLLESDELH